MNKNTPFILLGIFIFLVGFLINVQPVKAAVGDIYVDVKDELTTDLSSTTLYYYCTGGTEQSCMDEAVCDLDGTADIMVTPAVEASCSSTDAITARVEKDGYVTDSTLGYAAYATSTQNNGVASMLYAVKVTVTYGGAAVSGATVTVGDSYDTSCSEDGSTGVYYCAEPVAKTGASAKAVKLGYISMTSSYTDRTLQTSAQSTATIALIIPVWYFGINQPSISQIEVKISGNSAIISWKTDKETNSMVNYGLTTNYGGQVTSAAFATSHSLTLIGLSPSTTYHYQVKVRDAIGNSISFPDKIFTTLPGEAIKEEVVTKPISEMTIEELNTEIARITALIAQLQSQLAEPKRDKVFEGIPSGFKFERTLKDGMENDEVKYLQIILKSEIGSPTYPEDVLATGWFGPITKAAVINFQEKHTQDILVPWELTEGTGIVGKTTRDKLNQLLGK